MKCNIRKLRGKCLSFYIFCMQGSSGKKTERDNVIKTEATILGLTSVTRNLFIFLVFINQVC